MYTCMKVGDTNLGLASWRLENYVNSAVNGYHFESGKDKAVTGEEWANLSYCCAEDNNISNSVSVLKRVKHTNLRNRELTHLCCCLLKNIYILRKS